MSDLFSGLEGFGLDNAASFEIYEKASKKDEQKEKKEKEVPQEEEFLFDKTYKCPVCEKEFSSKTVRTGKAKLLSADMDLRPKYQGVDSLKYDAILCPKCGYAALNRYFNFVLAAQVKLIKENISKNFKNPFRPGKLYDYDEALARHKMALLNTVVKKGKDSEKAYTCLKTAWLYRGKKELLIEQNADKGEIEELVKLEAEFIRNAYEGFVTAFSKEDFPMCGMDQHTVMYMIAELARRCGEIDVAKRWVSKVLVARDANRRIKDKAVDLKELLQQ